jgi:hypothetical protein
MGNKPISFTIITTALILMIAGSACCQAELVQRDTSIFMISRGSFKSHLESNDQAGYTLTIGLGLLGRINLGFAETQWTSYAKLQFPGWWNEQSTSPAPGHRSQSGYLELLPFKFSDRHVSGSFGIGIIGGSDAGTGQGTYHGYTAALYGNIHPHRIIALNATFGQALVFTHGQISNFLQTNFGGGVSIKAGPSLIVSVNGIHSRIQKRTTTTTSFGLGYLLPRS